MLVLSSVFAQESMAHQFLRYGVISVLAAVYVLTIFGLAPKLKEAASDRSTKSRSYSRRMRSFLPVGCTTWLSICSSDCGSPSVRMF